MISSYDITTEALAETSWATRGLQWCGTEHRCVPSQLGRALIHAWSKEILPFREGPRWLFSCFHLFFFVTYVYACTCVFYFPCCLNIYFSPPCLSGCGDPRWTRYHSIGDLSLAARGISMHHLLHLQILPEQKEKTQPADNLKFCVFLSLHLHSICMWGSTMVVFWCHTYQIMLPFFLPILGISAYSFQATLSLTSPSGGKV